MLKDNDGEIKSYVQEYCKNTFTYKDEGGYLSLTTLKEIKSTLDLTVSERDLKTQFAKLSETVATKLSTSLSVLNSEVFEDISVAFDRDWYLFLIDKVESLLVLFAKSTSCFTIETFELPISDDVLVSVTVGLRRR